MNNLKLLYSKIIVPFLKEKIGYKNIHQIPKLKKIYVSSGLGLKAQNKKFLQEAIDEFRLITGQQPILTKAKKAISNFKLRKGSPIGLYVTLRKEKMYAFLEKFIKLVLPNIKDFNGLDPKGLDNFGTYNIGLFDQSIFPEIDYNYNHERRGFNITIVTTSKEKKGAYFLLKKLGIPFNKLINFKNDK
jgi:large subunit ribosomal protein L5